MKFIVTLFTSHDLKLFALKMKYPLFCIQDFNRYFDKHFWNILSMLQRKRIFGITFYNRPYAKDARWRRAGEHFIFTANLNTSRDYQEHIR